MRGATQPTFGRAAFSRADVADATRGFPAEQLHPEALGTGLRSLPRADTPAGFSAVVPPRPDYRFDGLQGTVDGRKVLVMHELYEVGVDSDGLSMPGAFHGVRSRARWSWMGWWETGPANAPFAARAVWAPASRVVVRVGEAAHLPYVCIRRSDRFPLAVRNLERDGLPGFRGDGADVSAELWQSLGRSGLATVLRALPHKFVELELDAGHLALVCNGYLPPEGLRSLLEAGLAAARGLRAAVASAARPEAFDSPLPAPAWADPTRGRHDRLAYVDHAFHEAYASLAASHGLAPEDPEAFHRAFPDQPVPGRAHGVLRGDLPGFDGLVRLAWFTDTSRSTDGLVRGAVLHRPSSMRPLTGEVHDPELRMVASPFAEGVACWSLERRQQELASDELLLRARRVLDRHGPQAREASPSSNAATALTASLRVRSLPDA